MNHKSKSPTLLSEIQARLRSRNRERWFRHMVRGKGRSAPQGFFDAYPLFLSSSATRPERERLNQRHRALIESNAEVIAERRILDIASHDGRWSFAAYRAGAQSVFGIEARRHLIDAARNIMREYGVPDKRVESLQGDVLTELDRLQAGRFDTVFCFGFLYHTIDHMPLLRKIALLKPKHLIIDTQISIRPANIIEIYEEEIEAESNGAVGEPGTPNHIVTGRPTKSALELMLRAVGFRPLRYYDWRNAGITSWDDLEAYYLGMRISLTCEAI